MTTSDLLTEFFSELSIHHEVPYKHPAIIECNYIVDNSEFVIVDGEEGDYGITKYFYNNTLIATRTKDCDDYWFKFTEAGVYHLKLQAYPYIKHLFNNIPTIP